MCAHALNTGTDADVNHTRLDLVRNVDTGLETGRALSVEGANGRCFGQTGNEGSGAHFGSTTAGCENSPDSDVFDEGRVDLRSLEDGLEDAGHEVLRGSVLEATLAALCQGTAAAGCDNDL